MGPRPTTNATTTARATGWRCNVGSHYRVVVSRNSEIEVGCVAMDVRRRLAAVALATAVLAFSHARGDDAPAPPPATASQPAPSPAAASQPAPSPAPSPRRAVPDYDGRGDDPTTAGDVLIW